MPNIERIVESHEKRLNEQEKRLNHHGKQLDKDKMDIQELKDFDKKKHERLLTLEENYIRLEKTVTKENEETRSTMREQTKKLFGIVEQAMGYQESRSVQTHELRMAKLNTWSTVFLKVSGGLVGLLSSGGVIYFIIEKILLK